MMPMKNDLPSE